MEIIPSTLISVGRLLVLNPEARSLSGGVPALDFAPSFADKLPIPPPTLPAGFLLILGVEDMLMQPAGGTWEKRSRDYVT